MDKRDASAHALRAFTHRLLLDGKQVAGFTNVSGIAPADHGRGENATITLMRGVAPAGDFARWVREDAQDKGCQTAGTTKTLVLQIHDHCGRKTLAFNILHARVAAAKWLASSPGTDPYLAIEMLSFSHEGCFASRPSSADRG